MSVVFKKMFFACVLVLTVLTTGAWQNPQAALALDTPETPLYSGITWADLGSLSRSITTSVKGD